ncbi:MAG: enoyl-CoA hydratase [Marmoricola sp.]
MIVSTDLGEQLWQLTIDRHDRRNALDIDHLDQLHDQFAAALHAGARCVVVTGEGTTFSAGADLDSVYDDTFTTALYRTLGAITDAPVPVIAAMNGPAVGAGAQLAIACDLRVGGDRAFFAIPTARNGLAVDSWTIRRLALLTNGAVARNVLIGAATLTVDLARRLGLIGRAGGLDEAIAWGRDIVSMAPLSLAHSKRALEVLLEPDVARAAELENLFDQCWASDDVAEGRLARTEGRSPIFEGK